MDDLTQVTLEAGAAAKLAELRSGDDGRVLRLGVRGGGCAGFQYMLALDTPRDDDLTFESHGQTVIVDRTSYPLVAGSTISYVNDGLQQGFSVDNPNVVAACGCGSSFQAKSDCPAAS